MATARSEPMAFIVPQKRLFAFPAPREPLTPSDATLGVARVARARRTSAYFVGSKPAEQLRQIEQFPRRTRFEEDPRTSICVLDTGVNPAHALLTPLISPEDCHCYLDDWGTDDRHGHGTAMSGICGYGDLALILNDQNAVDSLSQQPNSVPLVTQSAFTVPVPTAPADLG